MAIAKVEPLLTTRSVSGPFDYRLPEAMEHVGVGTVLVVPFGRRKVLGVVVGLADRSDLPAGRLAEPLEALEAGVPPELVELGRWVGEEYCSTPGRGLGLAPPPGAGPGGGAGGVGRWGEREVEATAEGIEAVEGGERLGLRQRAVLRALVAGPQLARRLAAAAGSDRATLRRLESRGLVTTREVERRRRHESPGVGAVREGIELTADQRTVLRTVIEALPAAEADAGGSFLLHGVTGSGKTEIYLEAARETLARGRGAIVLVPEIALTPQTMDRFRRRFGDSVALLHSKMPAGARYDEWRRLRSGEARICVGPRAAGFAPIAHPGLIVIDGEHDSPHKRESDPRYDARDVARRRAADSGAVLLCGTATPRPESWEELERLELPSRVDGRPLPPVEIVDMRGGIPGPLHPRTREAFGDVARKGGKAILLINRRGWSTYLTCRSCGHAWECPNCDVSLVLHRDGGLRCHHCGHGEPMPQACPECSSVTIARVGSGTQRVEAELNALLAPLEVFRLDSDSAAGSGHTDVLRRFEAAESGVLVGTQMVAKGHDFPDVTLSVVLDADGALPLPAFRPEERPFALIPQLGGRSGRGGAGGRVLVQALARGPPSTRHAARHDAAGFLAEEIERRRALRYPPVSHPIQVGPAGGDEARGAAGRAAPRRSPTSSRSGSRARMRPGSRRRQGPSASWSRTASPPRTSCSGPRRSSGSAASIADVC